MPLLLLWYLLVGGSLKKYYRSFLVFFIFIMMKLPVYGVKMILLISYIPIYCSGAKRELISWIIDTVSWFWAHLSMYRMDFYLHSDWFEHFIFISYIHFHETLILLRNTDPKENETFLWKNFDRWIILEEMNVTFYKTLDPWTLTEEISWYLR